MLSSVQAKEAYPATWRTPMTEVPNWAESFLGFFLSVFANIYTNTFQEGQLCYESIGNLSLELIMQAWLLPITISPHTLFYTILFFLEKSIVLY